MQSINQISTISIIGSGNVATALGTALSQNGLRIIEVFSPNIKNARLLSSKLKCNYVEYLEKLNPNSDLYIISTPDKEITNVTSKLLDTDKIIVHTSGSEPINIFNSKHINYGVFYPLQTFTKDELVDFKEIPICIEGSDNTTAKILKQLAERISKNVVILNSTQRQIIHLTAVTVNNFTNYLYGIAHDMLLENDIDFSLLHPLINETAKKIAKVTPSKAQTGPGRRNDIPTIKKHLELLNNKPQYQEIYKLLSNQIIKKYND